MRIPAWLFCVLANVAFVDAQIGRILDALERSEYADDTVVILTSDHGYHLGEKQWLFKNSVWEEATRAPLIVGGAGIPAGQTRHPPDGREELYDHRRDPHEWTNLVADEEYARELAELRSVVLREKAR